MNTGFLEQNLGRARVGLLLLLTLVSASCRSPAVPPPPPPPAPAPLEPPPAPAPAITLEVSVSSIEQGESTTLNWQSRNSNAVRIEPGIGEVDPSGSRQVSPGSSVTYTATATGPGGQATDIVRVTVRAAAPPPAVPPLPDRPALTLEELFRTNVQPIYFDYDQSQIRADQVGRLQNNARFLQSNSGVRFTISGHADERGSQEYNIGLGDSRANAVREFLVRQGIDESRISTVSFGEERPVCSAESEGCYQENRRAEFVTRGQ